MGVGVEDEGSFAVQPAVEAGAAGPCGDSYNKWVFAGVVLGWVVDIEVLFVGLDLQVAGKEGVSAESDGQVIGVYPVSLVHSRADSQAEGKKQEIYYLHDWCVYISIYIKKSIFPSHYKSIRKEGEHLHAYYFAHLFVARIFFSVKIISFRVS